MSHGPGKVERFVLDELARQARRDGKRAYHLADLYWGHGQRTPAQMESMRRALRMLARKGLIEARTVNGVTSYRSLARAGGMSARHDPSQITAENVETIFWWREGGAVLGLPYNFTRHYRDRTSGRTLCGHILKSRSGEWRVSHNDRRDLDGTSYLDATCKRCLAVFEKLSLSVAPL